MLSDSTLPFASSPKDDISDLFRPGHASCKFPLDGMVGFFSIRFATSNAKEMATYFQLAMGFEYVANRNLESGSRLLAAHVLKNGNAVVEVVSSLKCASGQPQPEAAVNLRQYFAGDNGAKLALLASEYLEVRLQMTREIAYDAILANFADQFVARHGMGVLDVCFEVTNVDSIYARAIENGAVAIHPPWEFADRHGLVKLAKVGVPDTDLQHTLVQRIDYNGIYLPGYAPAEGYQNMSRVSFCEIDHCVQNYSWNQMYRYGQFYAAAFGLHKYWSVDEADVSTQNTALRSLVMASTNGKVKMPINEPAESRLVGQIQEFTDFFGGSGVQHIALRTRNIIDTVVVLRGRGMEFNEMSPHYYDGLQKLLARHQIRLQEDMGQLMENHILVDFDPASRFPRKDGSYGCNYILQIFTKPLHDRPTFFFEIIQRRHHNGFGKGTFKGLFETIENQQRLRGTLVPSEEQYQSIVNSV